MSTFTVMLNSANKISGSNSDAYYFFDWSQLENRPYNMHLECNTEVQAGAYDDSSIVLTSDLLNSTLFSNIPKFEQNNYLGFATLLYTGGTTKDRIMAYGNPPVYLNTRPTLNHFNVKIYDIDGVLSTKNPIYSALLRFEPI